MANAGRVILSVVEFQRFEIQVILIMDKLAQRVIGEIVKGAAARIPLFFLNVLGTLLAMVGGTIPLSIQ